jgi:hypothetical protein
MFLVDREDPERLVFDSAFRMARGRDITGDGGGPFRGELGNQNLLRKSCSTSGELLPVIPPIGARRDASILGTVAINSPGDTDGVGSGEHE